MPFGQYKGTKLANVPARYLLWLLEEVPLSEPLKQYIEKNKDVLLTEVKRNSKFNSR